MLPGILGQFVRDEGLLSLEEAIRRMTSAPAARLGLKQRGELKDGNVADVVVFDPATLPSLSSPRCFRPRRGAEVMRSVASSRLKQALVADELAQVLGASVVRGLGFSPTNVKSVPTMPIRSATARWGPRGSG